MYMEVDLKLSRHIIIGGDKPYEGYITPTIDMITYDYG